MTRKCALCKGTNYKRTYSFFSAPKDPEIRKKWQAVIPIPNYTVTDDTYICSKHFKSSDIITHWVSGVPPHVITIKYKKCRLQVGAVPCLNIDGKDDVLEIVTDNHTDQRDKLFSNETVYVNPRVKPAESKAIHSQVLEPNFLNVNGSIGPLFKSEKCDSIFDANNTRICQTEYVVDDCSYKTYINNNEQIRDSINYVQEKGFDQSRIHYDYKYPQIHKVEGHVAIRDAELQEDSNNKCDGELQDARILCDVYSKEPSLPHNLKLEQNVQVFSEELMIPEDDPATLHIELSITNDVKDHDRSSESNHRIMKRQELGDDLLEAFEEAFEYKTENKCSEENLDSGFCDPMLFEDLLEIYAEVTLPRGWTCLVTSKGHTTTIVYLYMNMSANHIPIVEKEVYIMNDMVLHCGVGSKKVNPFLHNLIKDGRNDKVCALSDIEELIDELDQRYTCEGGPNIQNLTDIEPRLANVDGMKWRHVGCSIIINNGSSKCSKCVSLDSIIARKKNRTTKGVSLTVLEDKQKEIESLNSLLRKLTRRNQRLEEIRLRFKHRFRLLLANSERTIKNRISSSNMPEIQKLMIKECLKASMFKYKKNVRYSETWIFLCLLLYIESPRTYRYMFVNNYMTLPSIGKMREYFNQIKTDPQFYNLFQQSVRPYQPIDTPNTKEPL